MAYQMVATAVIVNDLQGHSALADVFKCNLSNICAESAQNHDFNFLYFTCNHSITQRW